MSQNMQFFLTAPLILFLLSLCAPSSVSDNIVVLVFIKIGMIERDEVEIGVTSFFATLERRDIVDFSPTIDYAE